MINLESILLLVVIALVLFIDYFLSEKSKDINGELVDLSDYKKKNYFAFDKSNIVYWFPVAFIIIGFFISDDLNLLIYKQTGLLYGSIISWVLIIYYVTFFSVKTIITKKTRKKLIAIEILYFFTIIFLSFVMTFLTNQIQQHNDKFVVEYGSLERKSIDCKTGDLPYIDKGEFGWIYDEKSFMQGIGVLFCSEIKNNGQNNPPTFIGLEESHPYDKNVKIEEYESTRYLIKLTAAFDDGSIKYNVIEDTFYNYNTYPLVGYFGYSAFIYSYLSHLLIIGYLWRIIFSLIFWSIKTTLEK